MFSGYLPPKLSWTRPFELDRSRVLPNCIPTLAASREVERLRRPATSVSRDDELPRPRTAKSVLPLLTEARVLAVVAPLSSPSLAVPGRVETRPEVLVAVAAEVLLATLALAASCFSARRDLVAAAVALTPVAALVLSRGPTLLAAAGLSAAALAFSAIFSRTAFYLFKRSCFLYSAALAVGALRPDLVGARSPEERGSLAAEAGSLGAAPARLFAGDASLRSSEAAEAEESTLEKGFLEGALRASVTAVSSRFSKSISLRSTTFSLSTFS